MGKKKKFIDKKKAATFQLLARDSSDPNYDGGPSGDRVFVRVDGNPYYVNSFFGGRNDAVYGGVDGTVPNEIFADAPDDYSDEEGDRGTGSKVEKRDASGLPEHIRREILELGFPDDGYNYMLHLREINNSGGGSAYYQNPKAKLEKLTQDVKAYDASRVEISRLNDNSYDRSIYSIASKTVGVRIQKAIDPEVAALLEDSDSSRFGSDVEDLEEDFVVHANLTEEPSLVEFNKKLSLVGKPEVNEETSNESKDNVVDEVNFGVKDGELELVAEKPRVRRLLDDQFDLLELQEYGTDSEEEFSGAESEENEYRDILGEKLNDSNKDLIINDLEVNEKYKVPSDLLHDNVVSKDTVSLESACEIIHRCKEYAEKYEISNEVEDAIFLEESSDESEVWDCETIISTYSNLDNHPGKIEAPEAKRKKKKSETDSAILSAPSAHVISLKGKEKLSVEFLPRGQTPVSEKIKDGKKLTEMQKRKQHGQESKEEKKERKATVKDGRREARRAKKELKGLYRSEAHHAQKVAAFSGPSSIHLT